MNAAFPVPPLTAGPPGGPLVAHSTAAEVGAVSAAVLLVALLAVRGALLSDPGSPHRVPRRRGWHLVGAISIGTLGLLVAFSSPSERLATESFTAHMVQHLLIISVAAPLLAFARVHTLALRGAGVRPPEPLRIVGRALVGRVRGAEVAAATVASVAAVLVWHVPAAYEAALATPALHKVEHATMLAGSYWFWALVLRRRTPATVALPAVLISAITHGLVGGTLTFARRPLYASYAAGSGDPSAALQDQQLAGLLMWIPGGAVYLVAAASIVIWSLQRSSQRVALREGARTHRLRVDDAGVPS